MKIGRSLLSGITITNCSTSISFFYLGASITNTFSLFNFTNVQGRIIKITQKSTITLASLTITNNSCIVSGLFQSGCTVYMDISSALTISGASISNVANIDTPGAFYIENSVLVMINVNMKNVSSFVGYGCLYTVNSVTTIKNSSFFYFAKGCMDFEKSTVTITSSVFNNTNITNFANYYGSIIYCLNCFNLVIDGNIFVGNKKNALDGSVKYY